MKFGVFVSDEEVTDFSDTLKMLTNIPTDKSAFYYGGKIIDLSEIPKLPHNSIVLVGIKSNL